MQQHSRIPGSELPIRRFYACYPSRFLVSSGAESRFLAAWKFWVLLGMLQSISEVGMQCLMHVPVSAFLLPAILSPKENPYKKFRVSEKNPYPYFFPLSPKDTLPIFSLSKGPRRPLFPAPVNPSGSLWLRPSPPSTPLSSS